MKPKFKPSKLITEQQCNNTNELSQLLDVEGIRMHIHCTGTGSPTVVLDSGLNQPGSSWMLVQRQVEKFTRVCSHDRAGYGLSEPGQNPRTSKVMVTELHTLLHKANIQGPYLLVGHSFGGINMRTFAALYPDEVMGLILVDSSHEDQRARMNALPSPKLSLKQRIWTSTQKRSKLLAYPFYKKSIQRWPKPDLFSYEEWQYHLNLMSSYKHFSSLRDALKSIEISKSELKKLNGNIFQKSLTVITRGKLDKLPNENNELFQIRQSQEKIWHELQKELATLSNDSHHIIANNSGHMIPHEDPELITSAVREMIGKFKSREVADCAVPIIQI